MNGHGYVILPSRQWSRVDGVRAMADHTFKHHVVADLCALCVATFLQQPLQCVNFLASPPWYIYMFVFVHIVELYACMHVCNVCMYVCMYVCIYVCICAYG